jgi:chromosome segregation ATPase
MEYRLQAVRDELLDQGAQTAEDASAVDMVRAALVAQDEALQKARKDLAAMRVAVAERETTLTSAQAQLQQDCATLEGARSWQDQAEEKAKEAEQLRANLANKAASLAIVEEQLQQERSTCQQVETQLQQERSALEEAWACLGHERSSRAEAQGQLQRACATLEEAQATLKLQDLEITRPSGELVQEGVSYKELRQAGEEKDVVILELQQAAATARASLELEKKQVEGESSFLPFAYWLDSFGIRSRPGFLLGFQARGRLSRTRQPKRRPSRQPTTLPSRSWRSCRPPL